MILSLLLLLQPLLLLRIELLRRLPALGVTRLLPMLTIRLLLPLPILGRQPALEIARLLRLLAVWLLLLPLPMLLLQPLFSLFFLLLWRLRLGEYDLRFRGARALSLDRSGVNRRVLSNEVES